MEAAVGVTPDRPILIDRFLHHAMECEADAISDGDTCLMYRLLWSILSLPVYIPETPHASFRPDTFPKKT